MPIYVKHFFPAENSLFVSEFGHSIQSRSKTVGPWSRDIYILHFIIKGYANFSGFKAEAGQAFLIAKAQLHTFTISDDYEHYWIGFDGEKIQNLFENFCIPNDRHQLFFVSNPHFAKELFLSVEKQLYQNGAEHNESLVLSLLSSMLPLLKIESASKTTSKIDYAERACVFIKKNYPHPLKMQEIANSLYISEKHLYRLFRNRFGVSPQTFLINTRMQIALDLLKNSDFSVTEIANSVGYTSLPSFIKIFTKYHGATPSAIRHH